MIFFRAWIALMSALAEGIFQTEAPTVLCEVKDLGHVKQRLRGHAAAENAESPEVFGPINDGGLQSE